MLFSFNQPGNFNIVWQKFTFENWAQPFAEQRADRCGGGEPEGGHVATLIATVLGSLIAIALSRYNFKGRAPSTCS